MTTKPLLSAIVLALAVIPLVCRAQTNPIGLNASMANSSPRAAFACRAQPDPTCVGGGSNSTPRKISGFAVEGVTLLESGLVEAVLIPLLGMRTNADLCRAVSCIDDLYLDAGFGGVKAYLRQRDLSPDGVVTIGVIEGRLSKRTVSGASQFSDENVLAALPALAVGEPLRMRSIDSELRMINDNPSKNVRVLINPGREAGDVEADVEVKEQPIVSYTFSLDNTGNEQTGRHRASVAWRHANVSDHDDVLSVQAVTSPDKPKRVFVVAAGYRFPFYRKRLTLDAFAAYSDVNGGEATTNAGILSFYGKGQTAGLRVTGFLPRWGEFDQRLGVTIEHREYVNRCELGGFPQEVCGPAGASVTTTPLTLDYSSSRFIRLPLSVSLSVARNVRIGGSGGDSAHFEAARPGARPGYTIGRFSQSFAMALPDSWQIRIRSAWQWSPDALIAAEQFGLGGSTTVRGYEERELAGDRGGYVTLEAQAPTLYADPFPGSTVHGFIDLGRVRNSDRTPCNGAIDSCSIASVGVGGRLKWRDLQLQLDLGMPLRPATKTDAQGLRTHFTLRLGL